MRIGIPKESLTGENKVAATPESITQLTKLGFDVAIEKGAGSRSYFSDEDYQKSGAVLVSKAAAWHCDIVYHVNPPTAEEIKKLKKGAILVSFIMPAQHPQLVEALNRQKVSVLAMDMVPRISRAQPLDALSSLANISGYRAVIEAANVMQRFFPGQITAAGKIPPAKVLVIGAGVAGLAAIGTAHSLGAIVRAFDTRQEVAEQIVSMGGEFLSVDIEEKQASSTDGYAKTMSKAYIQAEMELFARQLKEVDVVITTAAIPGKPSPQLLTKKMVDAMKPGSVIIDLAARGGGNCEYTEKDKQIITAGGVSVIGYIDMANRLPTQASQLYANNLANLSQLTTKKKGELILDFSDPVIRHMTICHQGQIMFPPPAIQVSVSPSATTTKITSQKQSLANMRRPNKWKQLLITLGFLILLGLSLSAPVAFLSHLMIFSLSCVLGYYVIWHVTHSLHTPLMSVTNAISGIVIIGALAQIAQGNGIWVNLLAFLGVLLVSINIFGGFAITHRMLNMFVKDKEKS